MIVEARHLRTRVQHADVRPVLVARAAIELGMLRIGVAVGNLWESTRLEGRIAIAA